MLPNLVVIISLLFANLVFAADYPPVTVGIVVPIQHPALDEIVKGFEGELIKEYPGKINFIVKNAQGDINLQRAIIQEFNTDQSALIVPISTTTTQMSAAIVKKKPIISLAAVFSEEDRKKRKVKNITNVDDESGVATGMAFSFTAIPNLRKVTIIHSASDKIMPEVATFIATAKTNGIIVQDLMVQQLSELYAVSSRIAADSQGVFILKDNLIASGIMTLITIADKKHLPLITSDNATVEKGAALALGVKESQIGEEGASLAAQVLRGSDISKIPVKILDHFFVFVNQDAVAKQGVDIERIRTLAQKQNYPLVIVGEQ